jgi:hypothetical protein
MPQMVVPVDMGWGTLLEPALAVNRALRAVRAKSNPPELGASFGMTCSLPGATRNWAIVA